MNERSKVWTCGCNGQLWFLTKEGECVCSQCNMVSTRIEVKKRPNPFVMQEAGDCKAEIEAERASAYPGTQL